MRGRAARGTEQMVLRVGRAARGTEATGGSTQNGRIQAVETQRQAAEATQRHRQRAGIRGSTEARAKASQAAQHRGALTGGTGSNGNTDTETETRRRDTEAIILQLFWHREETKMPPCYDRHG